MHHAMIRSGVERSGSYSAAFEQQLLAAQNQFKELDQLRQELKADEHELNSSLHRLRAKLEDSIRKLAASQARRAKLKLELHKMESECARYASAKAELTNEIHEITTRAAQEREHKLKLAGCSPQALAKQSVRSNVGSAVCAAPSAMVAEEIDLLGLSSFDGFDVQGRDLSELLDAPVAMMPLQGAGSGHAHAVSLVAPTTSGNPFEQSPFAMASALAPLEPTLFSTRPPSVQMPPQLAPMNQLKNKDPFADLLMHQL
eukprot:CAMPEP_0119357316 /NCGR_PEP_ID=MMETSP1334-20130426/5732_1 /TAXON_ID=127549 /ORGANISM="Calcidiscus leptoporus, Strain RCC1130" /LENGTH=257 /DNA_ID=CAMNT_0007371525 /DNA_START=8 /DNA_END=781 /DNA_ORIENTATION=-